MASDGKEIRAAYDSGVEAGKREARAAVDLTERRERIIRGVLDGDMTFQDADLEWERALRDWVADELRPHLRRFLAERVSD